MDQDWCVEFMVRQDSSSSDSFRDTFIFPTLAKAFNGAVDVALASINEHWKNEYFQGVTDAEAKQGD